MTKKFAWMKVYNCIYLEVYISSNWYLIEWLILYFNRVIDTWRLSCSSFPFSYESFSNCYEALINSWNFSANIMLCYNFPEYF